MDRAEAVNAYQRLSVAIQDVLDAEGDGWTLSHYIVVMGIERMNSEGSVDSAAWIAKPAEQPEYVTDGLISSVIEDRNDYCGD